MAQTYSADILSAATVRLQKKRQLVLGVECWESSTLSYSGHGQRSFTDTNKDTACNNRVLGVGCWVLGVEYL